MYDNSSFTVTFQTSLGELNVLVHYDMTNSNLVKVKVDNIELWNKLQKKGETIGQGCLFGGMPVKAAIEKGGFVRSGKLAESTEVIKYVENKSSETISWVNRTKNNKTASMKR